MAGFGIPPGLTGLQGPPAMLPHSNGHHAELQPAAAGASTVPSTKRYIWLGNVPTCTQCGTRGHEESRCTTPYCEQCCKYGHSSNSCSSACSTCGMVHKLRNCIVCKQCGMYGHLLPFCPETQCEKCGAFGHVGKDCISCPAQDGAQGSGSSSLSPSPTAAQGMLLPGLLPAAAAAGSGPLLLSPQIQQPQEQQKPWPKPGAFHPAYQHVQQQVAAAAATLGIAAAVTPSAAAVASAAAGTSALPGASGSSREADIYMQAYPAEYPQQPCPVMPLPAASYHQPPDWDLRLGAHPSEYVNPRSEQRVQQGPYSQPQHQQPPQPQPQPALPTQLQPLVQPLAQPQPHSSSSGSISPWAVGGPMHPSKLWRSSSNPNSGSPSPSSWGNGALAGYGVFPQAAAQPAPPPSAGGRGGGGGVASGGAAAGHFNTVSNGSSSDDLFALLEPPQQPQQQEQGQPPQQQVQQAAQRNQHQQEQHGHSQQQQQQQEQPRQQPKRASLDTRSSRSYSWLAQMPTCYSCGNRGHAAAACTTPFCPTCAKVGHAKGLCEQHCGVCGKAHSGKGCKQCKLCGMYGHLWTVCFDAHCEGCGNWGHTEQDCPQVCKCGYEIKHSPAECPGLCTRCLKYGHTTKDCSAKQCPKCEQWGQGCTDAHCVLHSGTATAAAPAATPPPPQHPRLVAVAAPSHPGSRSSSGTLSQAPAVAPATGGSSMWAGNSSNGPQLPQPPPPPPPPQQQQQQGGRVFVGGKLVQLEELLDAEDELRRTSLIDLLMNDARAEFNVYATQLLDAPEKLAVLIRLPKTVLSKQILPSHNAVHQMENVCAQCLTGAPSSVTSSRSRGAAAASSSSSSGNASKLDGGERQTAGEQFLPEHAAEFEAALPWGMLPSNWRDLTFRAMEEQMRWNVYGDLIAAKKAYRQAKGEAKAKTAAALAAAGGTGAGASQFGVNPPQQQQQQQQSQQQQQQGQELGQGRLELGQQQRPQQQQQAAGQSMPAQGGGSSSKAAQAAGGSVAPAPGAAGAAAAPAAAGGGVRGPSSSISSSPPASRQPSQQVSSLPSQPAPPARSTTSPQAAPSSSSPAGQPGSQQQQQQPGSGAFCPERVVLEVPPSPEVAAVRKEQFMELLLCHENGDLHDYGLMLVGDELKLSLLIRVPWEVLAECLKQRDAADLLDALAASARPPDAAGRGQQQGQQRQQQQHGAWVEQQVVQEDEQEEGLAAVVVQEVIEEDDGENDSEKGKQQKKKKKKRQKQQRDGKGTAAPTGGQQQQQQQEQQQEQGDDGHSAVGPGDLLPEHAALLEQEFGMRPGWQQCGSGWRVVENRYLRHRPQVRDKWKARRRELQALTAAALAAGAAAGAGSSRTPNSTSSGAEGAASAQGGTADAAAVDAGGAGSSSSSQTSRYRELLHGLQLREQGTSDIEAARVANTTTQLFAADADYTASLLASSDAGPKISFFSRLQQSDLNKVLQQKEVKIGEVLDGLYADYLAMQSGSGQLVVANSQEAGAGSSRFSKGGSSRCAQS